MALWLSLDEEDNDPDRFFTYLAAALEAIGGDAEIIQPSPNLSLKAIATILRNNLMRLPTPGILVLDDYHLIATESIHETLAFLYDHLPSTLHLVLITRSDPPLPLARMRVRGELNELREKDLRFTLEETDIFLNQAMGLNLSTQNIIALEARTEGWIASLQLAAFSLRDAPNAGQVIDNFSGTHHYVVDYLVEEVLAQRPPGTREFLLKTSILDRLSASLCDELLSSNQSQPSGEFRLFLDEGQPIQELMAGLRFDDAPMKAYTKKVLESFPGRQQSQVEIANQRLVEPLTVRELELLALVATGTTNREIAEQLVISYGTVRRHLNNIYGKLDVNGRAQAILKAQEQQLV